MAPWDTGFGKFVSEWEADSPIEDPKWKAHLQDLLLCHILSDKVTVDDLAEGEQLLTMANGDMLRVERRPGTHRVKVNGIVVLATRDASNGFTFLLDEDCSPGSTVLKDQMP